MFIMFHLINYVYCVIPPTYQFEVRNCVAVFILYLLCSSNVFQTCCCCNCKYFVVIWSKEPDRCSSVWGVGNRQFKNYILKSIDKSKSSLWYFARCPNPLCDCFNFAKHLCSLVSFVHFEKKKKHYFSTVPCTSHSTRVQARVSSCCSNSHDDDAGCTTPYLLRFPQSSY